MTKKKSIEAIALCAHANAQQAMTDGEGAHLRLDAAAQLHRAHSEKIGQLASDVAEIKQRLNKKPDASVVQEKIDDIKEHIGQVDAALTAKAHAFTGAIADLEFKKVPDWQTVSYAQDYSRGKERYEGPGRPLPLTHQEAFDRVCGRLLDGRGRAYEGNRCKYVTGDGNRCAVGALLTDEMIYDVNLSRLNTSGIGTLLAKLPRVAHHFQSLSSSFLGSLQSIHDNPDHWNGNDFKADYWHRVAEIAHHYHLKLKVAPIGWVSPDASIHTRL